MSEKTDKPVFTVSLYPPIFLVSYLIVSSAIFLVYGLATGVADASYAATFVGLLILLFYCLYYLLSRPTWRARFYKNAFSLSGRAKHGSINYGQVKKVSSVKMLFGILSAVEIDLKNERAPIRIPGNPRNFDLQVSLQDWLSAKVR